MDTVQINTGKGYNVYIGNGLIRDCGQFISQHCDPCRSAVITDSNVAPLYLDAVCSSLRAAGFDVVTYIFPAGEQSKNIDTLGNILEFFAESGLTRGDLAVALGGGVCGDITGFAAGCYMRGIRYVQMPTTFLAAVDSSVGGKTAVNLNSGKNLAGLFVQPEAVICDTGTMSTLPPEVFADGASEAIKTGILSDKSLFSLFEKGNITDRLREIIARCVAFKGHIVEIDEYENGMRKTLNLGHTVGHAVEKCSGYTIPHGHAVAIGTAIISRAADKMGWSNTACSGRIVSTLEKNGLPVSVGYSAEQLYKAALSDKKRFGSEITVVIPLEIGNCCLKNIPVEQLQTVIEAGLEQTQ